jgi:hypothetical protein
MHTGIEQQIGHIVGQRAPDQKFHGQIVDAFGVQAIIGAFGPNPALRQHVPDRSRGSLEAFADAGRERIDNVVEQQMPLVERIVMTRKTDRTAPVLLKKVRRGGRSRGRHFGQFVHWNFILFIASSLRESNQIITSLHGRISSHSRIVGSARLCS